jgi:hypothetical protein
MLQFSAIGTLALVALVFCWSLAIVLYRVGRPGSVARKLSLLLFVEGITLISTGYLDLFLTAAVRDQHWYAAFYRAEEIVHTLGDCAMLVLYPVFLAEALQTPLARSIASVTARRITLSGAVVVGAIVLWGPLKLGGTLLYVALASLFIFAFIASIHAWRSASGIGRTRAGVFAIAFGVRDICWGFVYGWATILLWQGTYAVVDPNATGLPYLVYALGTLLAAPLIAYGILRTQLFDIDLKIRWTIRQSTVAAVFVAVFYVVTEAADRYLASEFGNWLGLLATAILVLFLTPVQRFAERVATIAMPGTEDTPEYAAYRKLQVYEAALQDALPGGVSSKERALLEHLRDSLGIAVADAAALERDLLADGLPN